MSITPRVKSDSLAFIDKAFKNSAGLPSTSDATLSTNEKKSRKPVPRTAATIWLLYKEDPSSQMASAEAP